MLGSRLKRLLVGGSSGNEQLTLAVAALASRCWSPVLLLSTFVLAHLLRLPRLWRLRAPGVALRMTLVGASLVAGAALATATLPGADRLQESASAHVGFDDR
jgi:hypothetical protein